MSEDKKVIVYSTTYCPYCDMAKRLLKGQGIPYDDVNLDHDPDLRVKLSKENGGWRTVPMIFIGTEFIGGFQELADLHRQGTLKKKVQ